MAAVTSCETVLGFAATKQENTWVKPSNYAASPNAVLQSFNRVLYQGRSHVMDLIVIRKVQMLSNGKSTILVAKVSTFVQQSVTIKTLANEHFNLPDPNKLHDIRVSVVKQVHGGTIVARAA